MAVKPITNDTELRSATILLNANGLAMCNDKTVDEVVQHFCEAKDLLIEIYKYNTTRIVGSEDKK